MEINNQSAVKTVSVASVSVDQQMGNGSAHEARDLARTIFFDNGQVLPFALYFFLNNFHFYQFENTIIINVQSEISRSYKKL